MSRRTSVIEHWQSQLEENERWAVEDRSHRRWLSLLYTRVFRFLLSCYGQGQWHIDEQATDESHASRAAFEDHTDGRPGAEPKSGETIRSTLTEIHKACEASQPKPKPPRRAAGRPDWIAVASASGNVSTDHAVRLLRHEGLDAKQVRRGDDCIVQVPAEQRFQAWRVLERNKGFLRTAHKQRSLSRLAGALVGGLLGLPAAIFTYVMLSEFHVFGNMPFGLVTVAAVLVWLSCILMGAGHRC